MSRRSEQVDTYIAKARPFARPILRRIRSRFHQACPDLEETIKWGFPYFVKDGMVGGMSAFKAHVSLGFWNADRLSDPDGLLAKVGGTEMAAMKVAAVDELPEDAMLIGWVREAVALNESGYKRPRDAKRKDPESVSVPTDLMTALREIPAALGTYEGFSYSQRKEYVSWIESAKRPATRDKRIVQAVAWMADGKRRNWKYENC